MGMRWQVRLGGETPDLESLVEALSGTTNVVADHAGYVLESAEFDGLSEPAAVSARAAALLDAVNGLGRAYLDDFRGVRFAGVERVDEAGRSTAYDWATVSGRAVISAVEQIVAADGSVVEPEFRERPPVPNLDAALKTAVADPAVAKALRLYAGADRDWRLLYVILELILDEVGGAKAIADAGWASASEIRLFKHTANSPSALGDDARHGAESTAPPPKPMSLTQARQLVERVLRGWLAAKASDA